MSLLEMSNHPITPPPELVTDWLAESQGPRCGSERHSTLGRAAEHIATQAARWGADQELEACCDWPETPADFAYRLQNHRRPKPPTLKEQALNQLAALEQHGALSCNTDTIRRALEALSDD